MLFERLSGQSYHAVQCTVQYKHNQKLANKANGGTVGAPEGMLFVGTIGLLF